MTKNRLTQIVPGLWRFGDTCHVYVFNFGGRALAIDFGSGRWLKQLPAIGIRKLEHVFLTHHHVDQCAGLLRQKKWPFVIHAPAGEEKYLSPAEVRQYNSRMRGLSYIYPFPTWPILPRGIPGIRYDLGANSEQFLFDHCFRFVLTPGHGQNACTIIVEFNGRQIAFCGDAAYAGGKIWEPHRLEWDHWTGTGALAAWEGVVRLGNIGLDLLCPSHGPVISRRPRRMLNTLAKRLLDFYKAKGSICTGEKDHFVIGTSPDSGVVTILPHLYLLGNTYLLVSEDGKGLVVDPTCGQMPALEALLKELKNVKLEAAFVSHNHIDHCDGIPYLQRIHKVKAWLHPRIVRGLSAARNCYAPRVGMPRMQIHSDYLLPMHGTWQWHEYTFKVAPWPGQTWWHAVYQTEIDGKKVLFGGDSFQPASRWNGTGGFCAYNNSRFRKGFIKSAELVLKWRPDILANGHRCVYYFTPSRFRRIIRWARFAGKALLALCPRGSLEKDYYSVLH
jgi:glyoxylase-like metal-dependent hydrolase (beta-lactamase superfamily II)